jgi:4-amino-4-deoxy-L-arabinose transferase-like glycosyltransferase
MKFFTNIFTRSFIVIFILSVLVFTLASHRPTPAVGYDEARYAGYMNILHTYGIDGVRGMFQILVEKKDSTNPSPLRILNYFIGELSCYFTSDCGINNLVAVSLFSVVALTLVAFFLLFEWFTPLIAVLSSSLFIFSPLLLHLSGRALQDPLFALIIVSSILYYHRCWTRKNTSDSIILGILLFAGFLTKELMIFVYPCFVVVGIYYWKSTNAFPVKRIVAPLVLAPIVYLKIIIWIAGGADAFFSFYLSFSQQFSSVPYALNYHGPWFHYLVDFILVSPLTVLLAIVGMVIPEQNEKNKNGKNLALLYLLSGLVVFGALSLHNIRYLLFVDLFIRLFAVFGAVALLRRISNKRYFLFAMAFLVSCIIGIEIYQFVRIFVIFGTYDPVTSVLMQANGFGV